MRICVKLCCYLTLSLIWLHYGSSYQRNTLSDSPTLSIVFVYTVVSSNCEGGLPNYIRYALEQSIFTQPDCNTVLLSNIQECNKIAESVKDVEGLQVIDSVSIMSYRSQTFQNLSHSVFMDNRNSLWMTSALRFFLLEDLMRDKGWKELMHVEADNMLYGRITTILPGLRRHYPLAVTPLNFQETFLTASLFWVSNLNSLVKFNDFFIDLAKLNTIHSKYIDFLRVYLSKPGGAYPDATGLGVKPFAINEMSMMAYYHSLYPRELVLFPVVPARSFPFDENFPNVSIYSPSGSHVGRLISHGIWDSGSYGQFISGTKEKKGRNKRFTDGSHIIGAAIRLTRCQIVFWCNNVTENDYALRKPHKFGHLTSLQFGPGRCYTAPYVRCGGDFHWTPLWNLHVHSKSTIDFISSLCDCKLDGGKKTNITVFVDNDVYSWKPEIPPF